MVLQSETVGDELQKLQSLHNVALKVPFIIVTTPNCQLCSLYFLLLFMSGKPVKDHAEELTVKYFSSLSKVLSVPFIRVPENFF